MQKKTSLKSLAQYGVSFVIQHSFCCILPLVGALIGANLFTFHNAGFELMMAFIGALIGVKLDDFLHKKDLHDCACHHDHEQAHEIGHSHAHKKENFWREKVKPVAKKYALPLLFAIAVWSIHFLIFRDHH